MNVLTALLLLGAIGTTALPARALEPVPQPPGGLPPLTRNPALAADPAPRLTPPPAAEDPDAAAAADGPPAGALSLSQIIGQIESRPDFLFIRDIDWADGRYLVVYRTRDGRDRDLKIDPRTGRPLEGRLPVVPHWPRSEARGEVRS